MKYKKIDLYLEKIVFLINAEEGNSGIYELIWELSYYKITIEEKYKTSKQLLTEILTEELAILIKYSDLSLSEKIETVKLEKLDIILNNPTSWYPCNEIFSIELTKKGKLYLNKTTAENTDKLNMRFNLKS